MKKILFFVFSINSLLVFAQAPLPPLAKLAAFFNFNDPNSLANDSSEKPTKAQLSPVPPRAVCGIGGGAIEFRGNEYVILLDVADKFTTANFSLSFYFKPTNSVGVRDIFTNTTSQDSCFAKRAFQIQYDASAKQIKVNMRDPRRGITMTAKIDNSTCWQHVVFVRESNYHRLYVNGVRKSATYTPDNQRVELTGNSLFMLGRSECHPKVPGGHFRGLIDEFRLYSSAIKEEEAKALYNKPDRIKNQDVLLFIGNEVKVSTENTCASKHTWFPTKGVSDPEISNPTIKPDKAGTYLYTVRFSDTLATCAAHDTIKVTVIDPSTQPCGEVYVPTAFTPNGDDLNEAFGLSNPYTIGTLESFEVVDRWGGIMFRSTDPFEKWDGKFNGVTVQPGTYLYRVQYVCQGNKKSKFGSFVLMQ
jgi:gliding motility-associated-like protein